MTESSKVYAANWYPDPYGHAEKRYYDGTVWTEYVFQAGKQSKAPLVKMVPAPPSNVAVPTNLEARFPELLAVRELTSSYRLHC